LESDLSDLHELTRAAEQGTELTHWPFNPLTRKNNVFSQTQSSDSTDEDFELNYRNAFKKAERYAIDLVALSLSNTTFDKLEQLYLANPSLQRSHHSGISNDEHRQTIASWSFLEKMEADQQLKDYLQKSLEYLFIRDLGSTLDDKNTQETIQCYRKKIHKYIRNRTQQNDSLWSVESLLENDGVDPKIQQRLFWLKQRLYSIQGILPQHWDKTNCLRKLVKVIAGVVMHAMVEQKFTNREQQVEHLDRAITLGYCYGITYPFIDDVQDSTDLSSKEHQLFKDCIVASLTDKQSSKLPVFSEKNRVFMHHVYVKLDEALTLIKKLLKNNEQDNFFAQAYIFFRAQDEDRLMNKQRFVSVPSLLTPMILKSSGSRLIANQIVNLENEKAERFFYFGIYNQFNDDIKDIYEDLESDNLTPYTAYLKFPEKFECSPYRIYWSVVLYLIRNVYNQDKHFTRLILERSINAHKSLLNNVGHEKYLELKKTLLFTGNVGFDALIEKMVVANNNIAWFDKWLSRYLSNHFEQDIKGSNSFKKKYKDYKQVVDRSIFVPLDQQSTTDSLQQLALYSLNGGGKRMRSVIALHLMTTHYSFSEQDSYPVLQLLEYMHTASLIFDDLPAQDDADLRRGQPSLHKKIDNVAKAELTGVFLIMKAVEMQSKINCASAEKVIGSIQYAARTTQRICEGQRQDLDSNVTIDLNALEVMSSLKTGLALEAAWMIPALLAGESHNNLKSIEKLSHHIGIAFQIKDDLLDQSSQVIAIGKPVQQDKHKASYVTALGVDEAERQLMLHYHAAREHLQQLHPNDSFLKQLLDVIVFRDQ